MALFLPTSIRRFICVYMCHFLKRWGQKFHVVLLLETPPPLLQLGQYAFEILVDPPPTHQHHQITAFFYVYYGHVMTR